MTVGSWPPVAMKILRDTGADQSNSLVLISSEIQWITVGVMKVCSFWAETCIPLHEILFVSNYRSKNVVVGVCPDVPVTGVQVVLGNDVCGTTVLPRLLKSEECLERRK